MAWLKDVRPFVLRGPDLFRGRAPHGLGTRAYAADFNEVKAIGSTASAPVRADQTAAAQYWGLTNATGTISSILRSVAIGQGGTLADHARLLARAYTNAADALIVTWRDKARYSFWRPVTAIHEAASDGNDATEADSELDLADRGTALPRPSVAVCRPSAARSRRRCSTSTAATRATFSGTTPGGVTRHVHELLAGVRRHRRRARVVGHPLPVRRRGGRKDRAPRRPLGQPARLPLTAVAGDESLEAEIWVTVVGRAPAHRIAND